MIFITRTNRMWSVFNTITDIRISAESLSHAILIIYGK
jgi:hypothetical protein